LQQTGQDAEFATAFQAELERDASRIKNLVQAFVTDPADPPVGQTPRDEVWRRGKSRLYRYRPLSARVKPGSIEKTTA